MLGNNNFFWGLIGFFFFIWAIKTCSSLPSSNNFRSSNSTRPQYNSTIVVASEQAANGLDLSRLSEVIKDAKTASDLEQKLNVKGSINNLDLNKDQKVDYIKVAEYKINENKWGFSLTTEVTKDEEQEIATIEIEKGAENVNVNVSGNEQIYGPRTHYNSFYSGTSFFFLGYLLASHRPYFSPFGWGYYPSYYNYHAPVPYNNYRQNMNRYRTADRSPNYQRSSLNPNRNKVANTGIKKSLRNPTTTQRSFQRNQFRSRSSLNNQRRSVGRGGFGRTASPYRSIRGSTFGRSSGGFGK